MNDPAVLYDLLVRRLPDYSMFLIRPDGYFGTWNAGVQQQLGYSEQEFIGLHNSVIFTEEDCATGVPDAEMGKAAEEGQASDIRWHVRKDGSRFYGIGVLKCLRDEQGQIIAFAKIMSDETARKQLEDRLLESNESLDRFAHVVSHDLQEPLRTISSYVDLIRRRAADRLDPELQEQFQFIRSASVRLQELVRELLSYARLNAEHRAVQPTSLDDLMEAAAANLQRAVEESGAAITHDPLPVVPCDQIEIMQVFQNLLANALKYRNAGHAPQIHVRAEQRGEEWTISVRDNGIGFDSKGASRIFDPFRRLHKDQSQYTGSGMGLAIAKRIVERHHGRIWAESSEGQGATFYFTLPASSS